MEHLQTELSNLIAALSEANFNILIKAFNKEFYDAIDVRVTNGPYDGGIDLEIRIDKKLLKRNIQMTVQKTALEKKLKSDLGKAKQNAKKHAYLKNLDFYSAHPISGVTKRNWKKMAQVDYEIELEIFDCNDLAELSESYSSIKETIYGFYKLSEGSELIKVDKHTKVLYDMFAIGKDAGELKRQFLHSLILTFIFEHPDCTEEELFRGLKSSLTGSEKNAEILKSHTDSLRTKGFIIKGKQKFQMNLSKDKRNQIQDLLGTAQSQESLLKKNLEASLKKYDLDKEINVIVDFVYKSFQENYTADLEELSKNNHRHHVSIKKIHSDLIKFLTKKLKHQNAADKVSRMILEECAKNEYINKISASILFTKLFQSNKLEAYLSQKRQYLFLDTQILLRLFCMGLQKNKIPDVTMQSVYDFYETIKKFRSRIVLQTSAGYINELVNQIHEAIKLERFFKLPIVQKLGAQTNNVIYNYYQKLMDNNLYDKSLSITDFVSEILDFKIPTYSSQDFSTVMFRQSEKIFSFLDIEVVHIKYSEEFPSIKKIYEISLAALDKTKSYKASENDIRTIMHLSDSTVNADPVFNTANEPFLITWDNTFYEARKRVLDKYPTKSYWYIYTPSKFSDRISLQNFQLNPVAINNTIVSITESVFNTISNTKFIDLMSTLFNKEDLSDLKLAHRLITLEGQTKPKIEEHHAESVPDEQSPVIKVLLELRNHYSNPENKFGINRLITILEDESYSEEIFKIISTNVTALKHERKVKSDFFEKFDVIIETDPVTMAPTILNSQEDDK